MIQDNTFINLSVQMLLITLCRTYKIVKIQTYMSIGKNKLHLGELSPETAGLSVSKIQSKKQLITNNSANLQCLETRYICSWETHSSGLPTANVFWTNPCSSTMIEFP